MKKLTELTLEEYSSLNKMGFLFEIYPSATGSYKNDVELKVQPAKFGLYEKCEMWYICPHCSKDNITRSFKFCPDCGKKNNWSTEI